MVDYSKAVYLGIDVKFILPEDFKGDVADALELLAKYHRENKQKAQVDRFENIDDMTYKEFSYWQFNNLLDKHEKVGARWCGALNFCRWDAENRIWERLEL